MKLGEVGEGEYAWQGDVIKGRDGNDESAVNSSILHALFSAPARCVRLLEIAVRIWQE